MANKPERITYKQGITTKQLGNYVKATLIPIGVFFLVCAVVYQFGTFGKNIIAAAVALMWAAGAFTAWKIPSQRAETLKAAYIAISGYAAGLFLIRLLIGLAAQSSSEQLMATYNTAMPVSTGSTIAGYLQSMLWILAFITPITYLGAMGKKLVTFRKTKAKNKVLEQLRSIR